MAPNPDVRTTVVAALIERDGRLLIGQRRATDRHPLKWEFPGGKVEPGEDPAAALRRELDEELGIQAEIGSEVTRYTYQYPGRDPILLIFYRVPRFAGELRNAAFERIVWEAPGRLTGYDFLDGDLDFVRGLASLRPAAQAGPRARG